MTATEGTWEYRALCFAKAGGHVLMRRISHKGSTMLRRLDYNGEFSERDARMLAASRDLLAALVYVRDCIEGGTDPGMGVVHRAIAKAQDGREIYK